MAPEKSKNDKDLAKETALRIWRKTLLEDRSRAVQASREALHRLAETKLFHHSELARFYAQMMSGSAVPSDFGRGKDGFVIVASY